MLKILCISLVAIGGCGMLFGIVAVYRSLVDLKTQAHEQKIFADRKYTVCMITMIFLFLGYLSVGAFFINTSVFTTAHLIIAVFFFFLAVFACEMLMVLKRMSAALTNKTDEIIKTLVNTVEAKDQYTRGHSVHVANISELIYNHLPEPIKRKVSRPDLMDAAILHDIGKIGITDSILNKPDTLTPEERLEIEQHPRIGKTILENTSYRLVGEILYAHHERVDGEGLYKMPDSQIPLESKIIAVADTFSALSTDRVYRPKKSYNDSIRIIRELAGTQLDEEIVQVLCMIPRQAIEAAHTV
jgi:HD-GYP domain-containing protein (c-di-GMP phosphodiesterase class II)